MTSTNENMGLSSWLFSDEKLLIKYISYGMIVNGAMVACILQFVSAPYGRYTRAGWGVQVNAKLAWLVQELPAFAVPLLILTFAPERATPVDANTVSKILLGLYLLHYFQRCFIFPLLIRGGKPSPFVTFITAFFFCALNGYLQATQLLKFSELGISELASLRFWAGIILFFLGMFVNIHSDHVLRNLRKPGEVGYKIPKGGMFEYVSGANFLGEIVEWWGFALAGWSLPALAFAVFTTCNIGPRALTHHRWYKEKFDEYPKHRRALIPFII